MIHVIDQQTHLVGQDYLDTALETFLRAKKVENLTPRSLLFYRDHLKVFIKWANDLSVKYVAEITPELIRTFILWISESHNEAGTHIFFRCLRAWLRWWWAETDPSYSNPIGRVHAPKLIQRKLEGISNDTFDKLLSYCKRNTFTGQRDISILMLLLDSGIRASECTAIKLTDLDLDNNSVLIFGKGRKFRTVFYGVSTRRAIRKYLNFHLDNPYLFTNRNGKRLNYVALREILRRLATAAGIKVNLHAFRHAFALNQIRSNVDVLTVSRLLGHSSINLVACYDSQTSIDLQAKYKSALDNDGDQLFRK